MTYLGWLCWWSVPNDLTFTHRQAERAISSLGLRRMRKPIPADVFRRLTVSRTGPGSNRTLFTTYEEGGLKITLEMFLAPSTDRMLVRHIVRTARRDGVTVSAEKVGDAVFFFPPRGQHEKARMRVQTRSPDPAVTAFAERLRSEYKTGLTHFDTQAVRRLIRMHLKRTNAKLLEGGVYLMSDEQHGQHTVEIIENLGGHAYLIPIVDDEPRQRMLAQWTENTDGGSAEPEEHDPPAEPDT